MGLLSLLFSFNGRINRGQYWLGCGLIFVGSFFAFMLIGTMNVQPTVLGKPTAPDLGALGAGSFLILPVWLASMWSGLAIQVKRFHDRGRSGYWTLLPLLPVVMMISGLISSVAANANAAQFIASVMPWLVALLAINFWFFIELGCLPGKDGPNKYDSTPSAPGAGAPSGSPAPRTGGALSIPGLSKAPAPSANALSAAEQAITRAIAQQGAAAPPPVARAASTNAPATTPAGFGRRAAR